MSVCVYMYMYMYMYMYVYLLYFLERSICPHNIIHTLYDAIYDVMHTK